MSSNFPIFIEFTSKLIKLVVKIFFIYVAYRYELLRNAVDITFYNKRRNVSVKSSKITK